jgi:Relaxase/Mobilisation nuclease domain
MVARITTPSNIRKALNYNEQKVKTGSAELLYAHSFIKDEANLKFYDKLERFESLIGLNRRAKTNSLHVSLNFSPDEKIPNDTLVAIANTYMEKIGFGVQPFLVYKHQDAGHPHIHIVSTNIQKNGRRISLHNLGRNGSEKARKEIEQQFGLRKATSTPKLGQEVNADLTKKVHYGKVATKQAISNVLDKVLRVYRFSSLAELNAVLRLYNITADRGKEGSIVHRYGGLNFRVLDAQGEKIGVPIKASSLHLKPTLTRLEEMFKRNEEIKVDHKKKCQQTIDWILLRKPLNFSGLEDQLRKENITLIKRINSEGRVYGLTFIDHNSKCVFNGSDLGKGYSAQGIQKRLSIPDNNAHEQSTNTPHSLPSSEQAVFHPDQVLEKELENLFGNLFQPIETNEGLPFDLKKRKQKKRKH